MIRPQQIKLEDTNVALIGSDLDKQLRNKAAQTEEQWKGSGAKEGVEIWRIENFGVQKWNQPNTFYDNDSFIVLHTFKDKASDALRWNIHFWLGKDTSIDERGVAAYKTVELDDLLNGIPVQYREVQGYESDKFLTLFPKLQIVHGGIASAFRQVAPETYEPKLFHVRSVGKTILSTEIQKLASKMNHGDCYVLDAGLTIYVLKGDQSSAFESYKAAAVAKSIDDSRGGKPKVINLTESESIGTDFWKHVQGSPSDMLSAEQFKEKVEARKIEKQDPALYKLSDESGSLVLTKVQEAPVLEWKGLEDDDVFILDLGSDIYIWVGEKASTNEKFGAFKFAESYAQQVGKPKARIVRCVQGGEPNTFKKAFGK